MKVVVIGCTHAGTSAVKTVLKEHPTAEVTVFERNDNVSFLSCGIALYVGGVVKDPTGLFYSSPKELEEMGATIKIKHNVKSVDTKKKEVVAEDLTTGEEIVVTYDKLINTTGSWPIIPPIKGIEAKNILLCKNYEQANEIIRQTKEVDKVVIVGGGYIGIELVEAFAESGKKVTLIDGLDRILNKYLDKEFTDILETELQNRGVSLALSETVQEFKQNELGSVSSVVTSGGEYATDLVILCVGFRPNNDLLKGQVDMLPNGAIVIDEYMRTSDPDILAAGDSCAVHYNPNGGQAYIPLATNAVRMGSLVGKNLVEPKVKYRGTQSTSGLYLFGYNIGSTGVAESSAGFMGLNVRSAFLKDNYRPEFMPTTEEVWMKLVYEEGTNRIVGGQVMSKYDITQSANTLSLAKEIEYTPGPYICEYGFFQEAYRLESRQASREGRPLFISLMTITLSTGELPEQEILDSAMKGLLHSITSCLRKGDVVSKYSCAQYVLLLPTANHEACNMIIERIISAYYRSNRKSLLKIQFQIEQLSS